MKIHYAARGLLVICLLVLAWGAHAADKKSNKEAGASTYAEPFRVVNSVTQQLMTAVAEGKTALDTDPQPYFNRVREIMEGAVDFDYIARNVMGQKYWTAATEEQQTRFVDLFTTGLVETYAKGMANFADFEVSLQDPEKDIGDKRKVEVVQKFKGPEGVNRVSYTMGQHRSGDWKLINVVLDGVNLGKTLREQFAQSVSENDGDLDAAINAWSWEDTVKSET